MYNCIYHSTKLCDITKPIHLKRTAHKFSQGEDIVDCKKCGSATLYRPVQSAWHCAKRAGNAVGYYPIYGIQYAQLPAKKRFNYND